MIKNNFMKKRSPHVSDFSAHFNHVANVVSTSVLTAGSAEAAGAAVISRKCVVLFFG